jgi:hypothetical protein
LISKYLSMPNVIKLHRLSVSVTIGYVTFEGQEITFDQFVYAIPLNRKCTERVIGLNLR